MHDVRLLFDAMDHSWPMATYVTSMFLFTVWIVCRVIQLAWSYAEPHVYLWLNFRKESDVACYSDPAGPRVVQKAAHGARPQRLRDQSSMARARASARDQAAIGSRPMWLADRQTHRSGGDTAA